METAPMELPPGSADNVHQNDSLPAQYLAHLEQQKQATSRRTILIVAAVLLVGAAVIGTVLGITLTKNQSNSSTTMKPTLSPTSITSPVAVNPTSSPIKASRSPRPLTAPPTIGTATAAPTTRIFGVIQSVALNGGAEFLNTTYQSKARAAVVFSNRGYEDWQIIQRYALGCIYVATFGVMHKFTRATETQWKNSTGWLSSTEECTWYGIICNDDQRVVGINLAANNLTGSFPREVILLRGTLTFLNIGDNNIFNKDSEVVFLGQLTNLGKSLCDITVRVCVGLLLNQQSLTLTTSQLYR